MSPRLLRFGMNLWPPFIGAGIHVDRIDADWREAVVSMKLRWYNRNYVGSHFGGSLYAMTDAFYMLLMLHRLGPGYTVWDKRSSIDYISPGKGRVYAWFTVTDEQVSDVMRNTAEGDKYLPTYGVDVVDEDGDLVARIEKQLYIRRKSQNNS